VRWLFPTCAVDESVSKELAEIIREEIRRRGPISFSRWMELCLYHPEHGYYMKPGRKTGYGRDADFVTPPTLHPFFGACIGKELVDCWDRMKRPTKFRVLEFGGGEGDLARSALAFLDAHEPGLAQTISWHHAELSPEHRRRQASDDTRIAQVAATEYGGGPFERDDIDAHAIVACEVVDAIPFEVLQWTTSAWEQLFVALDGPRFKEAWQPSTDPPPWVWPVERAPRDGQQVVSHSSLGPWITDVPRDSTQSILIVDYGQRGPLPTGAQAVRAYRAHAAASWLLDPGDTDITASVDFAQTAFWANGFVERQLESFEAFLLRHGILEELNSIDRNTVEGASSYLRLRQLLLPSGMGAAFKVQRFDRVDASAETKE